jgi:hypothetical protein
MIREPSECEPSDASRQGQPIRQRLQNQRPPKTHPKAIRNPRRARLDHQQTMDRSTVPLDRRGLLMATLGLLAAIPGLALAGSSRAAYAGQDSISAPYASLSAATASSIAACSGSDATILRSERRTPLRRHSLISSMTSPRTKLLNSGTKKPSWRTARVQYRRLGLIIFVDRGWRAAFEGGDAGGTEDFGRHEPRPAFTAPASRIDALALDVLKECAFLWPIDVPEAEIVVVDDGHFDHPP